MKESLLIVAACLLTHFSAFAAPALRDTNLIVTELVSGLSSPTTLAFVGLDDILVLQKNDGKVLRIIGGIIQPNPVLDVNVDNSSERGLLGIALHPNFPLAPFVYLYFTESSIGNDSAGSPAANRVYRYTWNGTTLTSPSLLLDLPVTPGPNHDGGIISFGPDAKLYVVIGDLNRDGQLQNFPTGPAPDDTSVIFRLNDDGSTPNDNPFFFQGGKVAKYYAYGIRNSFGMAFDPITGKLWMTENGPNSYDEINMVEPGFNSGWEQILGPDNRDPNNVTDLFQLPGSHYSDPKFSWLSPVGPTGIVFLHSTALGAQYQFDTFVGDINNGNLYRFRPNTARDGFIFGGAGLADLVADNAAELDEVIFGTGFNGITDLKVGPDGRLYVISFLAGKIYVISSRMDTTAPDTSITSGPSGTTTVNSPTFSWTGTDNVTATANLVYASRLDPVEPGFSAFGSAITKSYSNLANGNYTFYVKAKDQAGNEDLTPASQAFTVNVTSQWTFCADENQFCSFSGTKLVRYGANGIFNFQTAINGISCNNGTFGDPIFGTVKHCEYTDTTTSWTLCADENQLCSFSGTKLVRYGANGIFNFQTVTNGISCNNATFGDPILGTVKHCDYTDTTTMWSFCADENQFCSFTGTKLVRYGANGIFSFQTATNGISCNNTTFGDPIFGTVKQCEYTDTSILAAESAR